MAKDKKKQAGVEEAAAKKVQGLAAKSKETATQVAVAVKKGSGIQKSPAKSEKKKIGGTEIDDIFGSMAAHSKASAKEQEDRKDTKPTVQQKSGKVLGSKDDIFGQDTGKGRKKTEEGWNIYTEDELGMGKKAGGDTDLCPFDCDCCF